MEDKKDIIDALTIRVKSLSNAPMDEQINNPLMMYLVTNAIDRCVLALLLLHKS